MTISKLLRAGAAALVLTAATGGVALAGNSAIIIQDGVYNSATTDQTGKTNDVVVEQYGHSNYAASRQRGYDNGAAILQDGVYNNVELQQKQWRGKRRSHRRW